jgi:hypothetical protein
MVGLLGAGLALGSHVCPERGFNLSAWLEAQQQLERECCRGEALDLESQRVIQRLEARNQVIDDLLESRLTLLEAASRFRDLSHEWPACDPLLGVVYPGQTEEECLCRQVIAFTRAVSPVGTEHWVRAHSLEKELAQLLVQGPLRLEGTGGVSPKNSGPTWQSGKPEQRSDSDAPNH